MIRWLGLVIFLALGLSPLWSQAASNLPAKPTRYVSDRAFLLDEPLSNSLNKKLEDFERETSNQVVVAVFPNLPQGAEVAQYSTEVFRAWRVGQADKDNGVVLFVYKEDRKLFIATGRGMEGALPDVLCKQIITDEIVPGFRQGDFGGGIKSGVDAILAATKGEYQGTGRTANMDAREPAGSPSILHLLFLAVFVFIIIQSIRKSSRDRVLTRRGLFNYGGIGTFGPGSSWGGGGSSGGGSSWGGGSGGGGGFSGGGGDSGGGGAGGSW